MHADFMLNNNVHIPTVYAGTEHHVDEKIFEGLNYEKLLEEICTSCRGYR